MGRAGFLHGAGLAYSVPVAPEPCYCRAQAGRRNLLMPRRPLRALVYAVLVGVTPLTAFAAPATQVPPTVAVYQDEWVQDATGAWVPAEPWTDPAADPAN